MRKTCWAVGFNYTIRLRFDSIHFLYQNLRLFSAQKEFSSVSDVTAGRRKFTKSGEKRVCTNTPLLTCTPWERISSDMRPLIYSTPPCHSRRCQEQLICGRRIAAVPRYHECRRRLDLERFLLQTRKPGIDCLQPFDIPTVSPVSSVNSKLYSSWRRRPTVSVNRQC